MDLYLARGYPEGLVIDWSRKNIDRRWQNRYGVPDTEIVPEQEKDSSFVVIKYEYNPILDYLSAHDIGNTIVGYWRKYLHAYGRDIILDGKVPTRDDRDWGKRLAPQWVASKGQRLSSDGRPQELPEGAEYAPRFPIPNVLTLNSLNHARWLISRKRSRNLFDLTNLWKKSVLSGMVDASSDEPAYTDFETPAEDDLLEEISAAIDLEVGEVPDEKASVLGKRKPSHRPQRSLASESNAGKRHLVLKPVGADLERKKRDRSTFERGLDSKELQILRPPPAKRSAYQSIAQSSSLLSKSSCPACGYDLPTHASTCPRVSFFSTERRR
jgi:hypothetical protein